MSSVITVENLSKKYLLTHQEVERYTTLRDAIAGNVRKLVSSVSRKKSPKHLDQEEFWALDDVNFEVAQGDRIGIVGRNGAGKSTLLKILSRISEPTSGRIRIDGRVASLLEVGTGFHPELTGRENIFLNGAILGMSKFEISRKFDEIVSFAEVERFLDTPVKRYSSGMYVRLAFSVAAHLDTEILILDEVLAVGDSQFQKKCLGKMGDSRYAGRTVLFVSHNMTAVQAMCNKAILLSGGRLAMQGPTANVVREYLASSQISLDAMQGLLQRSWAASEASPGNDEVRISAVNIIPESDDFDGLLTVNTAFRVEFSYELAIPVETYSFSMHFRNISGEMIFISGSSHEGVMPGRYTSIVHIPGEFLNNGIYSLEVFFVRDVTNVLFNAPDLMVFEVHDGPRESGWVGEFPGAVRPKLVWEFSPAAEER